MRRECRWQPLSVLTKLMIHCNAGFSTGVVRFISVMASVLNAPRHTHGSNRIVTNLYSIHKCSYNDHEERITNKTNAWLLTLSHPFVLSRQWVHLTCVLRGAASSISKIIAQMDDGHGQAFMRKTSQSIEACTSTSLPSSRLSLWSTQCRDFVLSAPSFSIVYQLEEYGISGGSQQ